MFRFTNNLLPPAFKDYFPCVSDVAYMLTTPEPKMIIGQDLLGQIRVSFRLNALAQLRGTVYLFVNYS